MESIRSFRVTLDITDAIAFCTDKLANAKNEIINKYIGRCYKESYLVDFIEIEKISDCEIVSSDISCNGRVYVQFSARVLTLYTGCIITDMKINTSQEMVIGTSISMPVYGVIHKMDFAKMDDVVPIRITRVNHRPMKNRAVIVGIPLTCQKKELFYQITDPLTPAHVPMLSDMFYATIRELALRDMMLRDDKIKNKIAFFESLLFAYHKKIGVKFDPKTWVKIPANVDSNLPGLKHDNNIYKLPDEYNVDDLSWYGPTSDIEPQLKFTDMNVLEIVSKVFSGETVQIKGIYHVSKDVPRSIIMIRKVDEFPENQKILGSVRKNIDTPQGAIGCFLQNIYDSLVGIRRLVETYDTDEKIISADRTWKKMLAEQQR